MYSEKKILSDNEAIRVCLLAVLHAFEGLDLDSTPASFAFHALFTILAVALDTVSNS